MNISTLQMMERGVRREEFGVTNGVSTGRPTHSSQDTSHIKNPEEAAKTFEKVLVEQFVNVMTEQLFKSNLAGDDGPGWMKAYGDKQRSVLTEVLSDHLVENGTFNIASLVLDQWQRGTGNGEDETLVDP